MKSLSLPMSCHAASSLFSVEETDEDAGFDLISKYENVFTQTENDRPPPVIKSQIALKEQMCV